MLGKGWWVPLHIITVIPLVDVSRAFAQYSAECKGMSFKNAMLIIMLFSLALSLLFCFKADLPINICLAAFLSVNIGGVVGVGSFNLLKKYDLVVFYRIVFSNLSATMVGGTLFFIIAYTKILEELSGFFGYSFSNRNIMPNLLEGWVMQTLFIWVVGSVITFVINNIIKSYQIGVLSDS